MISYVSTQPGSLPEMTVEGGYKFIYRMSWNVNPKRFSLRDILILYHEPMQSRAPEQHYQGAEGAAYHQVKRGVPERTIPWIAALRAKKLQPHINVGDTVFEFGVGSGWNLARLNCREKAGYDISEWVEQEVRNAGIEFSNSLSPFSNRKFDVVISHHSLEHLLNPAEALGQMHQLLAPGGKLLLFVPFEKERRYRSWDPEEPNHHLYSWNAQTLGNLVQESRFNVKSISVQRFGYERRAASITHRFGLCEFGFRTIHRMLHLVRPAYEIRCLATP
ncbi:MAG: class I SAM-dependent methyltransferase [Verrucomicrobiota bacterium]|nr:class I SAM-dependent methyltransferase [Verrucomicrobiota bacterium]